MHACDRACEYAHQYHRKVSSPGIWHRLQLAQLLGFLLYLHVHHAAETSPHMRNIARSAVEFNIPRIVEDQNLVPTKSMSAAFRTCAVPPVFICHTQTPLERLSLFSDLDQAHTTW